MDIIDGYGLCNEAHREFLPKKSKVFAIYFTVKSFNQLYISNKTERFSYKSGRAMQVVKLKRRLTISNFISYNLISYLSGIIGICIGIGNMLC